MSSDPINPYQPPGYPTSDKKPSVSTTRCQIDSVKYNLPLQEKSILFVARDHDKLLENARTLSQHGFILTDPNNIVVSRDHAQLSFDPIEKKLTIEDRNSSNGSFVEFFDNDGKLNSRKFVYNPGDESRDPDSYQIKLRNFRKSIFEEFRPDESKEPLFVEKLDLDFSKKWDITFGSMTTYRSGTFDVLTNDGSQIRHIRKTFETGRLSEPIMDNLVFEHNTLKSETANQSMQEQTRGVFNSLWARLNFLRRD
jgi:hypothetical protein